MVTVANEDILYNDDDVTDIIEDEIANDGPCVVMTGSIFAGDVHIYGPFKNSELALDFMNNHVSSALNPDWTYLESPPKYDTNDNGKRLLEFPASQTIMNEKGKVIGVQGILPKDL